MSERGTSRRVAPKRGAIDVGTPIFLMNNATFLLESAKRGANRGIPRGIGDAFHDLPDRRFAALKEEVHYLPLSAAQTSELVFVGHWMRKKD